MVIVDLAPMTGAELRRWREDRGLSQSDLARLLRVRQATLSEWERSEETPHGILMRLAFEELGRRLAPRARRRGRGGLAVAS